MNKLVPDLPDLPDWPGLPDWPAWLSRQRLDPAYAERCFAESDPVLRSRLKTAIAWHFSLMSEAPARLEQRQIGPDQAFATWLLDQPAQAAVYFLDTQAPARLLAALVPAILAGVPEILAISLHGQPDPDLCVALELAGIEQVFCLNQAQAQTPDFQNWLQVLQAEPNVRLLSLGRALPSPFIWQEKTFGPIALSDPADQQLTELLRRLHGPDQEFGAPEQAVAIYGQPDLAASPPCAQIYGPGLEACWLHPDLHQAFFRVRRIQAQLTES